MEFIYLKLVDILHEIRYGKDRKDSISDVELCQLASKLIQDLQIP